MRSKLPFPCRSARSPAGRKIRLWVNITHTPSSSATPQVTRPVPGLFLRNPDRQHIFPPPQRDGRRDFEEQPLARA